MLDLVIEERQRDIGGFAVGRILPFAKRQMVGPFIFLDHFGPLTLAPGIPRTMDVRPHPHIGLSTLTYLFAGEIMHRDSLGSEQAIRPGEINWMTAGRGITHSERLERARREGGCPARYAKLGRVTGTRRGNRSCILSSRSEWNFVSSSQTRIEQAKADWRTGRMKLPDLDNEEFVPLPEDAVKQERLP